MKLFKGQIEVRETDIVKVDSDYLTVFDKNGNMTYLENSGEYWEKFEFDKNGKETYYEDSDEYWAKREYDKNGNVTYYEDSDEYWEKREFDKNGNRIYFENSYGTIIDNRAKEMTVSEIEKELGYKIKIKGE